MSNSKTHSSPKATVAYEAANSLDECPIWHAAGPSFFWGEIEGKMLQEIQLPSKQDHRGVFIGITSAKGLSSKKYKPFDDA